MTSHEILKADVLDILFDNRNKMYGAYALRKDYNHRLMIALGSMMGIVVFFIFFFGSFKNGDDSIVQDHQRTIVEATDLIPEVPEPELPEPEPQRPPQNMQQQNFVNNIQFVSDEVPIDMPTMDDLTNAAISNQTVEGEDFTDARQPNFGEGNAQANAAPIEKPEPQNFEPLAKNAEYPGGQEAWISFLQRHLRTPDELEAGQKRTVLVRFAVAADGTISQFEIVQSGGEVFDKEVIRVLKKMPKWSPAVQNGHNVSVMFTQPVTFMAFEG